MTGMLSSRRPPTSRLIVSVTYSAVRAAVIALCRRHTECGRGVGADNGGVVPRELGQRFGQFLQPAVVRKATIVERWVRDGRRSRRPILGFVSDSGSRLSKADLANRRAASLRTDRQFVLAIDPVVQCNVPPKAFKRPGDFSLLVVLLPM